ncbi:phosphotransferase [Microbacterium sp. 1.5R]|uniref:phosphotransferase n=1 Tax=Microbacterium sp. 1.5R TaxID=1916917 RepID=UPI00119F9BA7|nr:phosphotransferase [Microbacterium sp. 1.5R]
MVRLEWSQLPGEIRARIEDIAGAVAGEAQTQSGGFSAGLASRVSFRNGRRLFVKAVHASSAGTFDLYRREADILRLIPPNLPAAHLIDAFTQGEWTVLVIDDVEGRHPRKDSRCDTELVLDAVAAFRAVPPPATLPRLADELADDAGSWARLEERELLDDTTPWCVANVDFLRAQAERVGTAVAGERLVHGDLRSDNILLDETGRARLLDWPWAARGRGWEDALLYLLDLRVADAEADVEALRAHPVFDGSSTEDHVSLLAAIGGGWFEKCRWPAPPGMTTLRDFQRREALAAVTWIEHLSAL